MKQLPIARVLRATVSLVALAAWFHASNHCAIGGMMPSPAPASEHVSCHAQEAPAESEEKSGCADLSCCDSLSAPALPLAKNVLGDNLAFPIEKYYLGNADFSLRTEHNAPIAELDTGPPGCDSFAEAVLQRSLLAHAPPVA